jgi:hypothetical protein
MNKYLPDNIDDFFVSRLKSYSEEPEEGVWNEIDKRLSAHQGNKRFIPGVFVMRAAAILLVYLSIPFLIKDNFMLLNIVTQNKIVNHLSNDYKKIPEAVLINTPETSDYFKNKTVSKQDALPASLQNPLAGNYSVAVLPNNMKGNLMKPEQLHELVPYKFSVEDLTQSNKGNEDAPASTTIKLHNKHLFSLMPFFSVDHITGRFIEQYEFDNLDKNDLAGRENPDMSFTAGLLAGYHLNKKFSLTSGISYSSSKLSVAGAAVKALENDNGEYTFKMATSYGFAELKKSGLVPAAGDTLLVSSAGINFNYISIPLMINYDLPGKKLKFSVHAGVAFNKLTSEKVEAEYKVQNNSEEETINKIEGIRRTFFTLNTGIDVKYSLNHTTDISIGPELRYGINAINKGTPVKTYPINYGLSLKLNFKL